MSRCRPSFVSGSSSGWSRSTDEAAGVSARSCSRSVGAAPGVAGDLGESRGAIPRDGGSIGCRQGVVVLLSLEDERQRRWKTGPLGRFGAEDRASAGATGKTAIDTP